MIKEKYIDAIKSRVDICQLVMDLAPERKLLGAGQNRKRCCCVFHSEKNPSMVLDTSLNMYKCFGCGKGGDVIRFVEDFKGMPNDRWPIKKALMAFVHGIYVREVKRPAEPINAQDNDKR